MKGLIISNGKVDDYNLLKELIMKNDFVVCADGGVNHILNLDIFPDIVLGDLDSIGDEELERLKLEGVEIKKFPAMKDKTDTELCVDFLLDKGYKEINLTAVTGSRLDHTISNIYLLKKIYSSNVKASIIDDNNIIRYTENYINLKKKKDAYISIIPVNEDGIIVSLSGFLYKLEEKHINMGSTMGISNKIIDSYGEIKIHKGNAIIIESKD